MRKTSILSINASNPVLISCILACLSAGVANSFNLNITMCLIILLFMIIYLYNKSMSHFFIQIGIFIAQEIQDTVKPDR